MLIKVIRYVIIAAFVCFTAFNLFMVYFGLYSMLLTVNVYLWGTLLLWYVSGRLIQAPKQSINIRLALVSLTLGMLTAEFTLRYVTETNLSYLESNGAFFHVSVYRRSNVQQLSTKISGFFETDFSKVPPILNEPNSMKVLEKQEFSYVSRFNSLGLRGNEPIIDTSRIAIVALGDSFTEGAGAPEDSSWVNLLQNKFNTSGLLSQKVQCINGGLDGSDVVFEFKILQEHLLKFRPQYVILSINSSDLLDITVKGGKERFTEHGYLKHSNAPWWEPAYLASYIVRAVVNAIGNYNWMLLTPPEQREVEKTAMDVMKQSILDDYLPLSVENNFKLIVALHPVRHELERDDFPLTPLSEDTELNEAVTVINLHPLFKAWKTEHNEQYSSIFWPLDGHFNSKGYNIMAEMLSDPKYY